MITIPAISNASERVILWNQFRTDENQGMLTERVKIIGYHGDTVHAYFAKPLGKGPFPGIVLLHHRGGVDEFYLETTRRFAQHGFLAICPDLYDRFWHGTPNEVSDQVIAAGGVPDDYVMGDCDGAMKYLRSLPLCNSKVGVIGTCTGGRHSFLAACRVKGLNAAVDCWGGRVVTPIEDLSPAQPVAPIDYTKDLSCPLLGLFGNDDDDPSSEDINRLEEELKKYGKNYRFLRYDGAGHKIWYYQDALYRPALAIESWNKVFEFFGEHLRS